MKKFMMKSAILVMAMTVAAAFTACSDDDKDETTLVVNNSETTVSINRLGGSIEIPITASGDWTAEVPGDKDGIQWAGVMVGEGSGDAKLQVNVDYLDPKTQQQERTTNLVVKCGDKTQTIRIRQYIGLKEGETAPNADTQPYFDLWFSKGIGSGLNPLTGDMTSPVLNVYGLKKAMQDGGAAYATLLRQTTHMNAANDVLQLDTLEDNKVGLTAKASVEVSYLKFKLKIGVEYKNTDQQVNNVKDYQAEQKLVFLDSYVDNMTVQSLVDLDPMIERGNTKNMFSIGFQGIYRRIITASKNNDEEELDYYIQKLIAGYGPVYITGAELGGSLFVAMRFDSVMVKNNFAVGGNLDLELALGPVNIKAGVKVDYSRNGTDIWSNSHHYANCSGGDQQAISQLASLINMSKPDPDRVKELGTVWAKSIISSDDEKDNTTLVKITYEPIWSLFPYKIAKKIKAYVTSYYKGKTLGIVNPEDLGIVNESGKLEK